MRKTFVLVPPRTTITIATVTVPTASVTSSAAATISTTTAAAAIATSAAAATAAPAVSTAATAAAAALRPFASFVHYQRPATAIVSVQTVDCGIHVGVIRHLHETKAARTARLAIHNYFGAGHIAVLPKQRL
jgi:hypothetical protein